MNILVVLKPNVVILNPKDPNLNPKNPGLARMQVNAANNVA
jgi:hypothetical protein